LNEIDFCKYYPQKEDTIKLVDKGNAEPLRKIFPR